MHGRMSELCGRKPHCSCTVYLVVRLNHVKITPDSGCYNVMFASSGCANYVQCSFVHSDQIRA